MYQYNLNMYVCGQLVDMCDSATHLGHLQIRKVLLNQLNLVSGEVFIFFMSNFGQLSYTVKCKLFNQYCSSFYGSPLSPLRSTIVEAICVYWRKASRSM